MVAAVPESGAHGTEYRADGWLRCWWRSSASGWRDEFYLQAARTCPSALAERFSGVYTLLYNKYYVDQIYDAMFVNRTKDLGTALGALTAA